MFFHSVEFARGGLSASGLILDCKAGCELIRIRAGPPQVSAILADKQFPQVAAILILRHNHLVPTDGNIIFVTHGHNIVGRTILVAANGLQVEFLVANLGNITNHIDH